MATRTKRNLHAEFEQYMRFIVNHKNYADLPNKFKANGDIGWVSPSDKERAKWWDSKIKKLGLNSRAEVARAIHPKELGGLKPCQICGKSLSIYYVYPNKRTLKKLNDIGKDRKFEPFKESIDEISKYLTESLGVKGSILLREVFDVPAEIKNEDILKYIKNECQSRLSPGVMSNPPDRLDGFHTYNACCRSKQDTGRSAPNLSRYTQDRRAYENWSEGDWNLSNRLMGEYKKYDKKINCPACGKLEKMTADHIGPISLGFTHRPKFNPLCGSCNSKKNNRITLSDVKELIKDERKGEVVISWHSKRIWDSLKNEIKTEDDALLLSKLMRVNLHHILVLLSIISEKGFDDFLKKFLHPEYSFVDYKFEEFDPATGRYKIIKKDLNSANKQKNADRYIRISFQSLNEYMDKKNRNQKKWTNIAVDLIVSNLLSDLQKGNQQKARTYLFDAIELLAKDAKTIFDLHT